MRYVLDANGYVLNVYFGCYGNDCKEYIGTIPSGYETLTEWSEKANINAYYIEDDNLVYDADKDIELQLQHEQETIDNTPILYKDLYGSIQILNSQYQTKTATGKVITINDVKRINPKVKFTNINCYDFNKIDIVTQKRNMLKNDAKTETIGGIKFTKLIDGGINIKGTSTEDIEYNLSGSGENTTSIFVIKKGMNYYLNIGGLNCEMKYYDGTTSQVYVGASGLINLTEDKEVTQVLINIPSGTTIDKTIYPMLEYGASASPYEEYETRRLTIDFSDFLEEGLFPSDNLFPSDSLYPRGTIVDYIQIEEGKIYISINGTLKFLGKGNVNLFDGYDTLYTLQDTNIEITYSINVVIADSISMSNGIKITNENGLLTNLQFNSGHDFNKLGYEFNYTKNTYEKVGLYINAYIPKDFTITSAYLTLYHRPINRTGADKVSRWGYARKINLYKYTTINVLDTGIAGSARIIDDSSVISKILNALGTNGFTPKTPSNIDFSTSSITSENIKNSLSTGINTLKIQTDESVTTTYGDEFSTADAYSCYAYATLNIVGYMSYESEE